MNPAELKKKLLEKFSSAEKPDYEPLSNEEVHILVEFAVKKIPDLLFREIDKETSTSDNLFISFSSFFNKLINPHPTKSNQVVNDVMWIKQILPMFVEQIRGLGLVVDYVAGQEYAFMKISNLRQYCNYDKLKPLT